MPGFKPLFAALDSPAVAVAVQISLMLHFWTWNVIYSGSYSWCQLESIKSFQIKEKFWLTWRHLSNYWGGRLERGPLFLWAQRHQLAHATKLWRSWCCLGISIHQFCILYFVFCICNCILTCIVAENICFLFLYCEWLWLCCFLPQGMLYLCCNTKQQRLSLGLLQYNQGNLCKSSCSHYGPTTFSDHNGPKWQHNINIGHCSKIKGTHSTHLVALATW